MGRFTRVSAAAPRVVWILAAGRFVNAAGSFIGFFLFLYLTSGTILAPPVGAFVYDVAPRLL
ncbi:hypothetical protein [Micromonospora zhanjiangensis]|uniref:MFS transporter n=1 Tax=Micromonospora zhanjiangensis TaxID=1522057 RepID=A0ABV8KV12_9ACTN